VTKLEELRELVRLERLKSELHKECTERLQLMTPEGLEEFSTETIRKVAELELVDAEIQEKWTQWKGKYPNG
jgi:hypothetical protein